jgi:hypothetical protein
MCANQVMGLVAVVSLVSACGTRERKNLQGTPSIQRECHEHKAAVSGALMPLVAVP